MSLYCNQNRSRLGLPLFVCPRGYQYEDRGSSPTSAWQVCIDKQAITFLSEADARSYVATLEARIAAPHPLPLREATTGLAAPL